MTLSPRPAEALPPSAVADALGRVCSLVEKGPVGWMVGGAEAGTSADSLGQALYLRWYTRPPAPPAARSGDPPLRRASLLSAFRAAHAGAASVPSGWTVMSANPRGFVSAADGEAHRFLRPGEYRMPLRPGMPPAPGEPVEPLGRFDHFDAERATWWSFGERSPEPPLGRLYLNARPATAARAIHEVTAALSAEVYQLKCSVVPQACERVDTIVVYHPRADRGRLLAALSGRWDQLGPLLDPATPPLTRQVRPGLAFADDVGAEHSYGDSRCQALASAIDAAGEEWQASDLDERMGLLLQGLRDAGIDPERPWEGTD